MNRLIRKLPAIAAAGALTLGAAWAMIPEKPAEACIHPPKEFKYPIKAGAQKALIFFADGRQEMVIRPSYKVEGEGLKVKNDAVEGFTEVAWLVPVPNLPDNYVEADEAMFDELEDFTEAKERFSRRGMNNADSPDEWKGEPDQNGAEFLEEVSVGDYTIQPVKAKGELGALELNGWLQDNGFGAVEADVMKYYQANDYYWLAVKLQRDEGLPADGTVKPLQIGFETEHPVYPLKINQGRGAFDLELWLITNEEVDLDKTKAFGLKTIQQRDSMMTQSNRKTKFSALPETVRKVAVDVDGLKKLKAGELYCYRFFGVGLNDKIDLGEKESDLKFEWKPEAEETADGAEAPTPPVD